MNLLNYLQSSPVIQWAMLLLSASTLVLTLTSAVKVLISRPYSTLTKSQKESLTSFLQILGSCSTTILPNLSTALTTALSNKGLLNMQNQSQTLQAEQTLQVEQAQAQINKALEILKEVIDEKH